VLGEISTGNPFFKRAGTEYEVRKGNWGGTTSKLKKAIIKDVVTGTQDGILRGRNHQKNR